jgi:hypothetical protein
VVDVRNVSRVAWSANGPVFGLGDGGVARARPPAARAADVV